MKIGDNSRQIVHGSNYKNMLNENVQQFLSKFSNKFLENFGKRFESKKYFGQFW